MPARHTTLADYQQRLLRVQQQIEARLDEPLDPAALARAAHFSLHHFHRIFRAQMGETVMQHVRRLRLERAARRLRTDDARLLELAIDAGYESHEAFTRAFIDRFGVPPSQFREQPSDRLAAWRQRTSVSPQVEVHVREEPEMRVAFLRHRGSYLSVGSTWQRLAAWAIPRGLRAWYGLCPDDPDITEEPLLRFDACARVGSDFAPEEGMGVAVIPGGTYAVGVHVGPYGALCHTYLDIIGRWFPRSGHELAPDAVVEHYLNDPFDTPEAALRTEVRVRIAD